MSVMDHLVKAIRGAAAFNPEIQVAPACILWPDGDRQWEAATPLLMAQLPELLVLGEYVPEQRAGPAIWLRCVLSGLIDSVTIPEGQIPILYLPGVSRQDLRAVETCPEHLKPLAELQYRGVIWSQINAKDWTILAYFKSDQGGLGLDVAQDSDAKNSMQLAVYQLLDEDIELLEGKRLDSDYFNTLLTGGDPIRDVLQWLDQDDVFKDGRNKNEWKAFVDICKSQLAFNPQKEGVLAGATKLAKQEGPWRAVWERFCEAPNRYPSIPDRIRQCTPPVFDLFTNEDTAGGWPQWNEEQEKTLQRDLCTLENIPDHEARKRLLEMERIHNGRRSLIWAEIGQAPLVNSLKYLAMLADVTKSTLAAGTVKDLTEGFLSFGWKADHAVLRALQHVDGEASFKAVSTAIRAVYLPWIEASARHLQHIVDGSSYPGGIHSYGLKQQYVQGECVLFVDGLRFDTAKQLVKLLEFANFDITEEPIWAALPSVTATGKAAVTPVSEKISGRDDSIDFEPAVSETGKTLKGGYQLKKLLGAANWTILKSMENGSGDGNAWCEFGDIDHEGHDRGWKLAKHIDPLLVEVRDRVVSLIAAGWKKVRIVTDHGWLLMPGGLPKIELPRALTENKWGRCASLKLGASTEERLYPWYWNPNQHFVLADGVSCFKKGEDYAHGGLSLQECVTLQLVVSKGGSASSLSAVQITDVGWRGQRCTVAINEEISGLYLDVRKQAGEPSTSVVVGIRPFKDTGIATVIVEDEELVGEDATLVLLDESGAMIAQAPTIIGG